MAQGDAVTEFRPSQSGKSFITFQPPAGETWKLDTAGMTPSTINTDHGRVYNGITDGTTRSPIHEQGALQREYMVQIDNSYFFFLYSQRNVTQPMMISGVQIK